MKTIQMSLLGGNAFSHEIVEMDPGQIEVVQTNTPKMVEYQKASSKCVWRPATGRKLAFTVNHKHRIIGLMFLASPVISMEARDKYLGLSKNPSERGEQLKDYFDLSVCVGLQPLAWCWNLGKLCALLSCTLGDFITERYEDCDFKGIITTSYNGRSIQYDRVFKFLGMTKGFGHEHVSDGEYLWMLKWMRQNNIEIPSSRFGEGSNVRMRRIKAYIEASGSDLTLQHGKMRGIYYHPSIDPGMRFETIMGWYERWGRPRYERLKDQRPPYEDGLQHCSREVNETVNTS